MGLTVRRGKHSEFAARRKHPKFKQSLGLKSPQ
jgi:hypothetical protein